MNEHPLKGKRGLKRIVNATVYSVRGLRAAWEHESAFRQEVVLSVFMLPAALWLGTTWLERAFLIATVVLVLAAELLNSAVEAAVDRVSMDMHPLAGRAKDMGSAAVFFTLLLCGGTWAAALWARIF
ncbi:MAG: diacylglycerol kinase [Burkholderiaceae bacterium]|jgi:diacylglycerol kinase (ATP)